MKQTIRRFGWLSMALLFVALVPVTACSGSDDKEDDQVDAGAALHDFVGGALVGVRRSLDALPPA